MSFRSWVRVALGYLVLFSIQVGVWALFVPRSFYDDFPGFGRSWVSVDGPFNEHLVRDVGALNLAVGALFVVAMIRVTRDLVVVSAVVALVWGVSHFAYHLVNADLLDSGDSVASLLGLALFAVLGAGLLYASSHLESEAAVR